MKSTFTAALSRLTKRDHLATSPTEHSALQLVHRPNGNTRITHFPSLPITPLYRLGRCGAGCLEEVGIEVVFCSAENQWAQECLLRFELDDPGGCCPYCEYVSLSPYSTDEASRLAGKLSISIDDLVDLLWVRKHDWRCSHLATEEIHDALCDLPLH